MPPKLCFPARRIVGPLARSSARGDSGCPPPSQIQPRQSRSTRNEEPPKRQAPAYVFQNMLHKKHIARSSPSRTKGLFRLPNCVERPPRALLGLPGWLAHDRFWVQSGLADQRRSLSSRGPQESPRSKAAFQALSANQPEGSSIPTGLNPIPQF